MKSIEELLAEMRKKGIHLRMDGGQLHFQASKGAMTGTVLDLLQARKEEIIAYLLGQELLSCLPASPVQETYPLSHAQRRLWFLAQIEESPAAFHISSVWLLRGLVDVAAVGRALNHLSMRHESLRTVFGQGDGEPWQRIVPVLPLVIERAAFIRDADPEGAAKSWIAAWNGRPFVLETGPMLRVALVELGGGRRLLVMLLHHIIADGWSFSLLMREFARTYNQFHRGQPVTDVPLEVHYRDYALWQRRLLASSIMEQHRDYWLTRFATLPPPLALPADFARPVVQTYRGCEWGLHIDSSRTRSLVALGRGYRVSLFMVLVALVKVVLFRVTGQRELIIGTPVAGRVVPELEPIVGCFLNMLPLFTRLDPDISFIQLLSLVRTTVTEAFDHQIYPFDQLVETLRLPRDLSRSPLFDVVLILHNTGTLQLEMAGLETTHSSLETRHSMYDLTIHCREGSDGLVIGFEYNSDLFTASRMARLGGYLLALIDAVLADGAKAIGRLPILPEAEQWSLLQEFNATKRPYPDDAHVVELFEEQVELTPDAVALVFGQEEFSFRQLDDWALAIAGHLRRADVVPGDVVGVLLDRTPAMVAGLLGVWKARGVYLPLDPAYPRERIAYMLDDSGASVLLAQPDLVDAGLRGGRRVVPLMGLLDDLGDTPPAWRKVVAGDLAYLIYTSGSTGRPKGVRVGVRGLVNFLTSMAREPGFFPLDRLLAVTTISFDIAALELFLPLLQGGSILLASREESMDGRWLLQQLRLGRATVMQATPATWRLLLAAGWQEKLPVRCLCGGEALPKGLARDLLARSAGVWNLYGPTETTVWSTCRAVVAADVAEEKGALSLGRPIANTRLYVLDEQMEVLPLGVAGELYIGGDGLALGYHGDEELTRSRFVPDPFVENPSGGTRPLMYRTGDRVRYRDDGSLDYLGRLDNQIKLRGYRIELGEIEAVINSHPAVVACVVVVRPGGWEGDERLVAYAVPALGQSLSLADLRGFLQPLLPDYMIPSHLVSLTALPLTPNGKVDRKALPDDFSPDACGETPGRPPGDDLERLIAAIYGSVLNTDQVFLDTDFFASGGHSLLAMKVIARLHRELGVQLKLMAIFRNPTVADLAEVVRVGDYRADEGEIPAFAEEREKPSTVHANSRLRGSPGFLWVRT